jgi:hypothetical protein
MERTLVLAATLLAASGCGTMEVDMRHPQTGAVAVCRMDRYFVMPSLSPVKNAVFSSWWISAVEGW